MISNRDEVFGTGVQDERFFAGCIDADDAESHAPGGELHGYVAETAAGAGDDDEGTRGGARFPKGGVGCYASAEHGL